MEAGEAGELPAPTSRVASAKNGSMWSVKNRNGAVSPYSSPWKSRGVKRLKRTTAAAIRRFAPGSRSPSARLPTWSWFCPHATIRAPSGRASSAAMRHIEPSKLGVVAVPLARQRDVERVVEGVEPHRVVAPLAERPEVRGPISLITSARGLAAWTRSASSASTCRRVVDRVDRVEPQAVDPVVAHPELGVLDRPLPHAGLRVVEPATPGRLPEAVGEIRAEGAQRLLSRPEVVVDDVEHDPEALPMGRVDEPRKSSGPP